MAKLYDKSGKEFNVPHAVDVKEWLESGEFSLDKPKGAKPIKVKSIPKPTLLDKA
jgi:hypothetical protein